MDRVSLELTLYDEMEPAIETFDYIHWTAQFTPAWNHRRQRRAPRRRRRLSRVIRGLPCPELSATVEPALSAIETEDSVCTHEGPSRSGCAGGGDARVGRAGGTHPSWAVAAGPERRSDLGRGHSDLHAGGDLTHPPFADGTEVRPHTEELGFELGTPFALSIREPWGPGEGPRGGARLGGDIRDPVPGEGCSSQGARAVPALEPEPAPVDAISWRLDGELIEGAGEERFAIDASMLGRTLSAASQSSTRPRVCAATSAGATPFRSPGSAPPWSAWTTDGSS